MPKPRYRDPADPVRAARLRTGWLVSFDPGLTYPAAAIWNRGVLVGASRVPVPGVLASLDSGERYRRIARLVAEWCLGRLPELPVAVATELPEIYSREREKNPNDLFPLAFLDGAVAAYLDSAYLGSDRSVESIALLPREWTGGIPKSKTGDPWLSPRGRILERRLSVDERTTIVSSHDSLDAVGIGLKVLGRLERTLPGTVP